MDREEAVGREVTVGEWLDDEPGDAGFFPPLEAAREWKEVLADLAVYVGVTIVLLNVAGLVWYAVAYVLGLGS